MASEQELFTINNVKEFYPQVPRQAVFGSLTLSLVKVSLSDSSYDTYLTLTLPSGKSLPVPASTHVSQTSRTVFEIMPSVELLTYLHEINDPLISSNEPKTMLDVAEARIESSSSSSSSSGSDQGMIIEQLQSIFDQYTLFANPDVETHQKQNVVLVDEDNGSIVGTLEGVKITESAPLPDEKCPVVVELNSTHTSASVRPATEQDLTEAQLQQSPEHQYISKTNDPILSTADGISKGLVYASETITKGLSNAANWYTNKYPATEKPLVFKESTKTRFQKVSQFTGTGAMYTRKAVGSIHKFASNMGERLTRKQQEDAAKKAAKDGTDPAKAAKPGVLNRSLIAFTTILDGVDEATRNLVVGTTSSSTKVINHKYGPEARDIARDVGGSLYNVTTVYIDIRGVSRRAILKGLGKGAAKGILGDKKVVLVNDQQQQEFMKSSQDSKTPQLETGVYGSGAAAQSSASTSGSSGAYSSEKPPLPARR